MLGPSEDKGDKRFVVACIRIVTVGNGNYSAATVERFKMVFLTLFKLLGKMLSPTLSNQLSKPPFEVIVLDTFGVPLTRIRRFKVSLQKENCWRFG